MAFLSALSPVQWLCGSLHPDRGRMTFAEWTAGIAAHYDNHLTQIGHALAGSPTGA